MRYDVVNLRCIRYPFGDEAMVGIMSVAAIADHSGEVHSLAGHFDREEITVRYLQPYSNIIEHFECYRPDVIMLSSDSLGIELFAELTRELTEKFSRMPLLINIAKNRTSDIDAIARKYQGYYFAEPPFSEVQEARFIQHFLLTKVVSEDYYLNKIKDCVRLTLSAMKCEPKTTGFKYLTEAVQEVIKQPYRRFNFSRDVYPKICTRYRIGMQSVEAQIKSTIRGALEKMSDYEKSLAFEHYPLKNGEPTVPEFIHAAAAITSQPCKKILRYLEDEPFLP